MNYKVHILFYCLLYISIVSAQNLQIHYDFSQDRSYFTSTLEMYRPDERGATFWFVDFDYNEPNSTGASLGYWEIARYFKTTFNKNFSLTLQFNDGVASWGSLGQAWLAGGVYAFSLNKLNLSTELMYRQLRGSSSADGQLTFVFFVPLLSGRAHFTGFMDIWTQDEMEDKAKKVIIMSQPQIWYTLSEKFYIGGEVRITKNFSPQKGWHLYPTMGVKWEME